AGNERCPALSPSRGRHAGSGAGSGTPRRRCRRTLDISAAHASPAAPTAAWRTAAVLPPASTSRGGLLAGLTDPATPLHHRDTRRIQRHGTCRGGRAGGGAIRADKHVLGCEDG